VVLSSLAGCGASRPADALGAPLAKSVSATLAAHVSALASRTSGGGCHDFNFAACQAAATLTAVSYTPVGPCRPQRSRPGYNWSCVLTKKDSGHAHPLVTHYLVRLDRNRCWVELDEASPQAYDSHVHGCLSNVPQLDGKR
jgi:hypothetical protein